MTAGQEEGSQPSLVLPLLQFRSVAVLFLWMIVPLGMTIYFSFIRKNLLNPELSGFAGLENYRFCGMIYPGDHQQHHLDWGGADHHGGVGDALCGAL